MSEQKLKTCLWFNDNAEEAVTFYTSVFKNSKVGEKSYYGEGAPLPKGTLLTASFELNGQEFMVLNGGPHYAFSPAISFVIACQTQDEIDHYWEKLSAVPEREQCGWLQDRFGVSWQVVPAILGKLMSSQDKGKSARVMQAFMKMKKFVIADLISAFETDEHQHVSNL